MSAAYTSVQQLASLRIHKPNGGVGFGFSSSESYSGVQRIPVEIIAAIEVLLVIDFSSV